MQPQVTPLFIGRFVGDPELPTVYPRAVKLTCYGINRD